MKHRIALYLFLLATLCMGCGGRLSMRELEGLEARMNDAPDSVLAVLTAQLCAAAFTLPMTDIHTVCTAAVASDGIGNDLGFRQL